MNNRIFGYARISDRDQNENRQIEELAAFGVKKGNIKTDKASGKNFNRKEYLALVGSPDADGILSKNDLLVISSIDRLGRNYDEIMEQWRYITKTLEANIKVLDMPLLDTRQERDSLDNKFVADLVLQILSYVAEKERINIKKRQRQGIDVMPIVDGKRVSVKTGRPTGRPKAEYPENWIEIYSEWKSEKITAVSAFTKLGLTKNTYYNLVKRYESGN